MPASLLELRSGAEPALLPSGSGASVGLWVQPHSSRPLEPGKQNIHTLPLTVALAVENFPVESAERPVPAGLVGVTEDAFRAVLSEKSRDWEGLA